jgi:hypothetical protein
MPTRHGTLTANTAASVSVTGDRNEVGVTHKNNVTNPLYVRADGTTAVINANDTFVVQPGQTRWVPRARELGSPTAVSLISAGAVQYEVEFP